MRVLNFAKRSSLILLTIFNNGLFSMAPASAAPASPTGAGAASGSGSASAAASESKSQSGEKLHRADFRVSGASCVACLRRIGKTIREQPGVSTGDVSILRPYWAVVVYDASKTNMDKIFQSIAKEKVKFEDMDDKAIASLPLIVVPKGLDSGASANASAGTSGSAAKTAAKDKSNSGMGH